jgi:hypothetical protein
MSTIVRFIGSAVFASVLLAPALAVAQPPAAAQSPLTPQVERRDDPKACSHEREKSDAGKTLSDRLAQSNGVICPPAQTDPQMTKPPPPGGTMPVIPPPGTPGGDQHVQPK